jgi:hypothetical protein
MYERQPPCGRSSGSSSSASPFSVLKSLRSSTTSCYEVTLFSGLSGKNDRTSRFGGSCNAKNTKERNRFAHLSQYIIFAFFQPQNV